MEPTRFDDQAFFGALEQSGARALLIGRRALVVLGLPVLTADYDFWLHPADIERFNEVGAAFALVPTRSPDVARGRGRYVLENDEHIDVLVVRSVAAPDGQSATFDEVWERRQVTPVSTGVSVALPSLGDLILTKKIAARPKDLEDIRLLEILRSELEP